MAVWCWVGCKKGMMTTWVKQSTCSKSLSSFQLIDKMSLGAGALKVEGPVAQKGSIALEETMATKQAPTTAGHRRTERVQWNTYHNAYLPIRGWEEWERKPADITGRELQWSAKISKAKQGRAEICNHIYVPADPVATPHASACLELNRWPSTVVSRLTLPKLQFRPVSIVALLPCRTQLIEFGTAVARLMKPT